MRNALRDGDKHLAAVCLGALILLVVAQIVARVVFLAPLIGAEELVRYFLICIVFFGAPFAARNGGHIRMEELTAWLPPRLRSGLRLVTLVSAVVVFGIVSYGSCLTFLENLANRTATLSIPFPVFIFPTVAGFILLTMEYALVLFRFVMHPDVDPNRRS